jgi:hypothetical protein
MYEESALREARAHRDHGSIISDEAARSLADMWRSSALSASVNRLATEGEWSLDLASDLKRLRDRVLTDGRSAGEVTELCSELDALIAWAERRNNA